MKKDLIVTIDGPSGSGKSTIAKLLAQKLGYDYIDTGAMYRGVAYAFKMKRTLRRSADTTISDQNMSHEISSELLQLLEHLNIKFEFKKETKVLLDDNDISTAIREPEISILASILSRQKIVREYLYRLQRDIGKNGGVVLEGRDTGSVVFPNAQVKVFLDADTDERAKRRHLELKSKGNTETFTKVKKEMIQRDINDSQRNLAPLIRPEGAIYIDTTGLSISEVLNRILQHVP